MLMLRVSAATYQVRVAAPQPSMIIMRDQPINVAVEGPPVMWLKMPRASNDTSGKLVNAPLRPYGYRARTG